MDLSKGKVMLDHLFRYTKFDVKVTFLTPMSTCICAYQGARNVNFTSNLAYVINV